MCVRLNSGPHVNLPSACNFPSFDFNYVYTDISDAWNLPLKYLQIKDFESTVMPAAPWDYSLLLHTLYFKLNANIYANLHKTLQLRLIEMSEVMQVFAHKLMYWRN